MCVRCEGLNSGSAGGNADAVLDPGKELGTHYQKLNHRVVKTGNRSFEKMEQNKCLVTTLKN